MSFWQNDPVIGAPQGAPQGTQPVFTVPERPSDVRAEQRDNRAEQRDDARLGFTERGEARDVDNTAFQRASTYRTEFLSNPEVRQFREIRNISQQIGALAKREGSAMGDLGLVFSFMKSLDPGSTVMAGEQATAQNAAGVPGQIRNAYNSIVSGERLNDQQRGDMASIAQSNLQARAGGYNDLAQTYRGLLEAEGFDPEEQGITLFEIPEVAPTAATTQDAIRSGTAEVRFGDASDNQVFDRSAYLEDQFGITRDTEARLAASFNQLSGSETSTNQIAAIYGQLGIPLPGDEELQTIANDIREGKEFGGFDTAAAEQQYIGQLREYNERPGMASGDEEAILQQGATWGLSDEGYGVAEAVRAGFTGRNIADGYAVGRDGERLALEEARERQGALGVVGELGAGLMTGGARVAPLIMRAASTARLPLPVARSAAREAVREGTAAGAVAGYGYGEGAGGSATGAVVGGVIGNVAARGINAGAQAFGNRLAARQTARAPVNEPVNTPRAPSPDDPAAPPSRPGAANENEPLTEGAQAEIAALAKKATGSGPGARQAKQQLALKARTNPVAKAAADRLDVDLPLDILSDDAQVQSLVGLARSQVGSDAEAAWRATNASVSQRADDVFAEIEGTADLAQLSDDVFRRMETATEGLQTRASALRDEVTAAVPADARSPVSNLEREVADIINNYGGLAEAKAAMTGPERTLLKMLGEGEEAIAPTYARLNRLRDDIGTALNSKRGPWADVNEKQLARYYRALADDQLEAIESIAGPEIADKQRSANSLFKQMYDQREAMTDLFGKNLDKGLAPLLRRVVTSGGKGDAKDLTLLLNKMPQDMRGRAVVSALFSQSQTRASHGGFSFANYAKTYRGLRQNGPVFAKIAEAAGPEATRIMRDLYTISNRMARAENYVLKTGKSTQGLDNAMKAEGILGAVFGDVADRGSAAAGAAAGGLVAGPGGAAAGVGLAQAVRSAVAGGGASRLDKVHKLLTSTDFVDVVEDIAKGANPDEAVQRLWGSPAFHKLAKSLGYLSVEDRRGWLSRLAASRVGVSGQALGMGRPVADQLLGPARLVAEERDSTSTTEAGAR